MKGTLSLETLFQPLPVIGVYQLQEQIGISVKFLWGVAQYLLGRRAEIIKVWLRVKTIAVDNVLGVFHQLPISDLGLTQFRFNILSLSLAFAQFLLDELDGDLLDGLSYVSLRQYVSPLYFSFCVPEQSGVRGTLLAHYSMEFAAHPFPTPRGLLLKFE
jgi:hypothetical protein